jgi:kinesin family protein 6/9
MLSNARENYEFNFTRILDNASTQEEVFECVALPVVENCLEGYNGTIFAYGQTGSGKTFTMNGGGKIYSIQTRGNYVASSLAYLQYNPLLSQHLLDEFENRRSQYEYKMSVSFMEIYNENAYDLLENRHIETPFEQWNKVFRK